MATLFRNASSIVADPLVSKFRNDSFPHSNFILPLNEMEMTEKEGTECGMIDNHSALISVIE